MKILLLKKYSIADERKKPFIDPVRKYGKFISIMLFLFKKQKVREIIAKSLAKAKIGILEKFAMLLLRLNTPELMKK